MWDGEHWRIVPVCLSCCVYNVPYILHVCIHIYTVECVLCLCTLFVKVFDGFYAPDTRGASKRARLRVKDRKINAHQRMRPCRDIVATDDRYRRQPPSPLPPYTVADKQTTTRTKKTGSADESRPASQNRLLFGNLVTLTATVHVRPSVHHNHNHHHHQV